MQLSERVQGHLRAGRIPRAMQLIHLERMAQQLGVGEQQIIRDYGRPPLMAMPEVVYLLGQSKKPADGEPVKIGTTKNVARRIDHLQAGALHKLYLVAWIEGNPALEREIHAEVAAFRIREDWFEMCEPVREAFRVRIEEQARAAA